MRKDKYKTVVLTTLSGACAVGLSDMLAKAKNQTGWLTLGIAGGFISISMASACIRNVAIEKIAHKLEIKDDEKVNEIQKKKITKTVDIITGSTLIGLGFVGVSLLQSSSLVPREQIIGHISQYSFALGGILSGVGCIPLIDENQISDEEEQIYKEYKIKQKQLKKQI